MVFVWSRLTNGDPLFTLTQVALNDTIMVFAFAPLVALLLGIASITVPWDTLLTSVVLYIVIPVAIAQLWRRALLAKGQARVRRASWRASVPRRSSRCCATLVLLFAFQGEEILRQPLVIAMLAVPILVQVFFNSSLAYWLEPRAWARSTRRLPLGAHRRDQLLRAGGSRGDQPLRLRVGRGAGDRGRRAHRGAGDAARGPGRQQHARLVRNAPAALAPS